MREARLLFSFLFLMGISYAVTMVMSCGTTATTDGEWYTVDMPLDCFPDTSGITLACNNCVLNYSGMGGFMAGPSMGTIIGVDVLAGYTNVTIKGDGSIGFVQLIGFTHNIKANNSYNVSIWNMTLATGMTTNIYLNGTQGFEIKNVSFTDAMMQLYLQGSRNGIINNFTMFEGQRNTVLVGNGSFIRFSKFNYQAPTTGLLFDIQASNYTTFNEVTIGNTSAAVKPQGVGSMYIRVFEGIGTNITNSIFINAPAIYLSLSNYNFINKVTATSPTPGQAIYLNLANYTTILNSTARNAFPIVSSAHAIRIVSSSYALIANSTVVAVNDPAVWLTGNDNIIANSSLASINGSALHVGYGLTPIIENLYLDKNLFTSNVSYAVELLYGNHTTIVNSTLTSSLSSGLFAIQSNYTLIDNNTITSGTGTALYLYNTRNNNITNCRVASTGTAGLIDSSHNISIRDSTFTSVLANGLYINYSNTSTIIGSSFYGEPTMLGIGLYYLQGVGVNITNTTASGGAYGVVFSTFESANLTNLTAISGGLGASAFYGAGLRQAIVTNSTLIPAAGNGISLTGSRNITVVNSSTTVLSLAARSNDIIFINTTLDRTGILWDLTPGSNLTVKWYANFTVDSIDSNPIAGASVNATPSFGGQALFNGTTDSKGDIWELVELTEFTATGAFIYDPWGLPQLTVVFYNNYTFYANKSLYLTNYTNQTINESTTVGMILRLIPTAPLVNLTQPANATNTTNYSVEFGYTVIEQDGDDIVNTSVWIWYVNGTLIMIYLNTTPVLLGPAPNNESINLSAYQNFTLIWNVQACDDTDLCAFNESNRTLILYLPPPAVEEDMLVFMVIIFVVLVAALFGAQKGKERRKAKATTTGA